MNDRYEQLKAQFIKEIIGNGEGDRPSVERRVTRLRDAYFEKEDRLMQSVKDVKAEADKQFKERALGRLQEEKAALDDAILDVLEGRTNVKLPPLEEAAHIIRKATGLPHRQVNFVTAGLKALLISALYAVGLTVLLNLFFSGVGIQGGGIIYYYQELSFFDATYLTIQKLFSGGLLLDIVPLQFFFPFWFAIIFLQYFAKYRKRR